MCKLHTGSACDQESFFFLTNIVMKLHWMKHYSRAWCTVLHTTWFMKICTMSDGNRHYYWPYVSSQYFSLILSSASFLGVAHAHVGGWYSTDTWGGWPSTIMWLEISLHGAVQGLTWFFTHLSEFTVLHFPMSNGFKPVVSRIFSFLKFFFRQEAKSGSYYFILSRSKEEVIWKHFCKFLEKECLSL